MTLEFIKFVSCFCCLFKVDERALRDIMEMGFNREAARQALLDHNNNLEAALNYLLTGANQPKAAQTEQSRPPPRGKAFGCRGKIRNLQIIARYAASHERRWQM